MIKGDWIKKGAAVIDVGTNSVEDKSKKSGTRWSATSILMKRRREPVSSRQFREVSVQ